MPVSSEPQAQAQASVSEWVLGCGMESPDGWTCSHHRNPDPGFPGKINHYAFSLHTSEIRGPGDAHKIWGTDAPVPKEEPPMPKTTLAAVDMTAVWRSIDALRTIQVRTDPARVPLIGRLAAALEARKASAPRHGPVTAGCGHRWFAPSLDPLDGRGEHPWLCTRHCDGAHLAYRNSSTTDALKARLPIEVADEPFVAGCGVKWNDGTGSWVCTHHRGGEHLAYTTFTVPPEPDRRELCAWLPIAPATPATALTTDDISAAADALDTKPTPTAAATHKVQWAYKGKVHTLGLTQDPSTGHYIARTTSNDQFSSLVLAAAEKKVLVSRDPKAGIVVMSAPIKQ